MSDSGGQGEKSALEVAKLTLEQRLLQRQLSAQGLLMSWLQAASVPVALFGAILAFFVGFGQLRQSADNQAAERFDKTLTRLGSLRPDERMTGVSGLQLFLGDEERPLLQKQALQFLINGLSLEVDTRVRGAILDVLTALLPGHPSQPALNAALRTAVERNRSLTSLITGNWRRRITQQQKQILTKLKISDSDLVGIVNQIPKQVIAKLTTEQYLMLLGEEHGIFQRLDPAEEVPLLGLSKAIQTLIARGATTDDFRGIYCADCNFNTAKSLEGAVFENAYLERANFTGVNLRKASFKNADIGGTNFFGADLTGADLRVDWPGQGYANKGCANQLPLLECTKLSGADLSGQPLVLFIKDFNTTGESGLSYQIKLPRMISVQLDASTKLNKIGILTATSITDDYLKQHPKAPEIKSLTKDRDDTWASPILEGWWARPDFRRLHGTFAEDPAKYSETIAMMHWALDANNLGRLGGDAYMLRGFVDQPTLKALPLYSKFVDAVAALNVPKGDAAKAAQAWSEKATKTWTTMQPLPCTEHANAGKLLLDLGSRSSTYTPR